MVYQLRSYASPTGDERAAVTAAQHARADLPFLFKAFEIGQIGPKKMAKMHGGAPRVATIHEYLDWTLTCATAEVDGELVSIYISRFTYFVCVSLCVSDPIFNMINFHSFNPRMVCSVRLCP